MAEPLADRLISKIDQAADLYHRLVILAGAAGAGKTAVLRTVHEKTAAPLININLELSRQLLDLTARQRSLQLSIILANIVAASGAEVTLLDNIEILFDVNLQQDPLRLLQGISRNRTVVAAWNGTIEGNHLVYAIPGHAEYRRYPLQDYLIVAPEATSL